MRETMKSLAIGIVLMLAQALLGRAWAADVEHGKQVYELWCADCHAATGERYGLPAGFNVLQKRYQGSRPAELDKRTDLSVLTIKTMVRNGLNVMPRTRKTEISDAELDDLVAYLRRNNP
jgi:mono/diheme cytochrome c family protein